MADIAISPVFLDKDIEILDYFDIRQEIEEVLNRQNFLRSLNNYVKSDSIGKRDIFFTIVDEDIMSSIDVINLIRANLKSRNSYIKEFNELKELKKSSNFYNIFSHFKIYRKRLGVLSDIVSNIDKYTKSIVSNLTLYYGLNKGFDGYSNANIFDNFVEAPYQKRAINFCKNFLENSQDSMNELFDLQGLVYDHIDLKEDMFEYLNLLEKYINLSSPYFADYRANEDDFFYFENDRLTSKLTMSEESFNEINTEWIVKKPKSRNDFLVNVSICYNS